MQRVICVYVCVCAVPYTSNCANFYKWPIPNRTFNFSTRTNDAQILFTCPAAERIYDSYSWPLFTMANYCSHRRRLHINSERMKLFISQFSCSAYMLCEWHTKVRGDGERERERDDMKSYYKQDKVTKQNKWSYMHKSNFSITFCTIFRLLTGIMLLFSAIAILSLFAQLRFNMVDSERKWARPNQ